MKIRVCSERDRWAVRIPQVPQTSGAHHRPLFPKQEGRRPGTGPLQRSSQAGNLSGDCLHRHHFRYHRCLEGRTATELQTCWRFAPTSHRSLSEQTLKNLDHLSSKIIERTTWMAAERTAIRQRKMHRGTCLSPSSLYLLA